MRFLDPSTQENLRNLLDKAEKIGYDAIGAIIILLLWGILSYLLYKVMMFFFRKIKLNELIDRFKVSFDEENISKEKTQKIFLKKNKFTDKIKVDDAVSRAASYYILVVFFRMSISHMGITDVEDFLGDVITYLPNLFVGILIGFFGIRFSNFIYEVVYHALIISKGKTAKIIAEASRFIILFFTLMIFLEYTKLASPMMVNTLLIGFIAMLSLAGWLAFWLWGKDIAKEILETFGKKEDEEWPIEENTQKEKKIHISK